MLLINLKSVKILILIGLLYLLSIPLFGLTFDLTDLTVGGQTTEQANGFIEAADFWSEALSDDVTLFIQTQFDSLPPNIIGGASSTSADFSFTSVKSALSTDQSTENDAVAVNNLPSGSSINFRTQDSSGTGTIILDNNNTTNNTTLSVNRANAKALGLIAGNDTTVDAFITFSDNFNFDFDSSDGIASGSIDFVGIAIHEIGHVLGFISGVDTVDTNPGSDLNDTSIFSPLDLFRYSDDSIALGSGVLDLAVGGIPYLSIDGGNTNDALFSTGATFGDGQQASHFKDNLDIGIMDPTFALGEFGDVTGLDYLAFDVIGWDITSAIPEPAETTLAFGLAIVLLRIGSKKYQSKK